MFLLSSFTWYPQFSLFTFRSPTSVPDFGLMYLTFGLCLWQLYSCWHGGNSSAWSLRITTVSGMFPVTSFPCIYYSWGLPLCQCVTSIRLAPVLENLYMWVASSQCRPHMHLYSLICCTDPTSKSISHWKDQLVCCPVVQIQRHVF